MPVPFVNEMPVLTRDGIGFQIDKSPELLVAKLKQRGLFTCQTSSMFEFQIFLLRSTPQVMTKFKLVTSICSYLKEEWKYLNDNAIPLDLPISERIWKNLPRRIEKKKITLLQPRLVWIHCKYLRLRLMK